MAGSAPPLGGKKLLAALSLLFLSAAFLSCGLEEYYYIEYVPEANIKMDGTYTATVALPSISSNYFDSYIIYYRIYITTENSGTLASTSELRNNISSTLNIDFNNLLPITNTTSTTVNTSNVESTFYSRNFYRLALEGSDINAVLGSSSGGTLEIHFPTSTADGRPYLKLNGSSPYNLFRSNKGKNIFTIRPNQLFVNTQELCDSDSVTDNTNADTAKLDSAHSAASAGGASRHTYVSMYIVAAGSAYLTPVYSIPTFIGIFKLPEQL